MGQPIVKEFTLHLDIFPSNPVKIKQEKTHFKWQVSSSAPTVATHTPAGY